VFLFVYCTCTAGLSGCCSHVTATLYYMEEYINRDPYTDKLIGCTEIRPRKQNVEIIIQRCIKEDRN